MGIGIRLDDKYTKKLCRYTIKGTFVRKTLLGSKEENFRIGFQIRELKDIKMSPGDNTHLLESVPEENSSNVRNVHFDRIVKLKRR